MKHPYNRHCIDCIGEVGEAEQRESTHFLIWVGTFVCEFCADKHKKLFGSHTTKDVLREHWDDYQLRSVAIGGNKKFYEHLLEYEIERFDVATKYIHEAVVWYSGHHVAMMDD